MSNSSQSISQLAEWETQPHEMRFIGSCLEFIGPVGRQPEKLFELLDSGVDSEWFINEFNSYLYEAIAHHAPSIGEEGAIIKQQAILSTAEELSGKPGWAKSVAKQCLEATYDFQLQEFIEEEIPSWRIKLKRPKVKTLLAKVNRVLDLPPSPDRVAEAESLFSRIGDEWDSDPLPQESKDSNLFNDVRNQVLTPRKPDELVSSGLEVLDFILGGGFGGPGSLEEGKLITLMARPGQGKTQVALNIAMRVAMKGYKVGFWELEMQTKQLALRMQAAYDSELCRQKGYTIGERLTYDMLRTHNITGEARERYVNTDFSLLQENARLFYDSNLTADRLVHQMRLFYKRYPETRLFVVDHIGLLSLPRRNGESDVTSIGDITKALKGAATDLGVDIIQLCQLNRGVEARTDKMPTMSDARGSGRIEEDSDVVLGLMRPYYYDPGEDKTLMHIGALKNRQGVVGVFDATIDLECCAVYDRSSN
jgi:hypothetical protein